MNNFDKIICINLKERKDKYNNVKNVFDKLNINVDFYYAEKHKTSGRIGCFESHIHVIENCYNNNLNNILIFEDDVINTPNYNENIMIEINNFVKLPGVPSLQYTQNADNLIISSASGINLIISPIGF